MTLSKNQTVILTKILDGLRQHVSEASLVCDQTGISLSNIDTSHVVAVNAFLKASWFTEFECPEKGDWGVNLTDLYQRLKTVGKATQVTIASHNVDGHQQIAVEIRKVINTQQSKLKRNAIFYLDAINIELEVSSLSRGMTESLAEYPIKLDISSADFKEIIDQMKVLKKEQVVIEFDGQQQLLFRIGENSDAIIEYEVEHHDDECRQQEVKICLGVEKLIQIGKCINLSDQFELCLNSDFYPVYFRFDLENAGHVIFGLSPRIDRG